MIELEGYGDNLYNAVAENIRDLLIANEGLTMAQATDESDPIAEEFWDRYASEIPTVSGEKAYQFRADYSTWDDMLDSYREGQWSNYEESRIG